MSQAAPPAAPSGITAEWKLDGTGSAVTVSWQDNSDDEGGFRILSRIDPEAQFNLSGRVGPNITTFTFRPSNWNGCILYEFTVFSAKYAADTVTVTEQTMGNIVTVTSPPYVLYSGGGWKNAEIGTAFTWVPTVRCPTALVWSAVSLPAGLVMNETNGTISGIPTEAGRFQFSVSYGFADQPGISRNLRIVVYKPVPAMIGPATTFTIPPILALSGHPIAKINLDQFFNDPDVTAASRIVTNMGTMDLLYFSSAAPLTVANFQGYLNRGDLVNTIVHRSAPRFVIQGGGYLAAPRTPSIIRQAPVLNEPLISNTRGTVSMAKSASSPNSATSEFFVSLANNSVNLNNQNEGFTVFGRLSEAGMAVADEIASLTIKNFSTENGVLSTCPVLNPPPEAFSVASLVTITEAGPVAPLSYTVSVTNSSVCQPAIVGNELAITPLVVGTTEITVTARDLDEQTVQQTFALTVNESYESWRALQGFVTPAEGEPLVDSDGDGSVNLAEFAFGTLPRKATVASPRVSTVRVGDAGHLAITFPMKRRTPAVVYTVQTTSNLSGTWGTVWQTSDGGASPVVVTGGTSLPSDDILDITIRDSQPITIASRRFIRVKITIP